MHNHKIKAVIIDDDEFIHHQLKDKLIQHCPEVNVIACAENAAQGLAIIRASQPQLVFLDIQMPEVSGFELLNQFDNPNFSVIFITSYNQYAIQALRYSALDYLLKPINADDLKSAVARYVQRSSTDYLKLQMENLIHNLSKHDAEFRLIIASRTGDISLPIKRIVWCEGDSNYTHFHLSDSSKITASKTLREFEEILSEKDFLRVHKSHLVNINHVSHITGEGQLVMLNDTRLEVAKRRLREVKSQLEERKSN